MKEEWFMSLQKLQNLQLFLIEANIILSFYEINKIIICTFYFIFIYYLLRSEANLYDWRLRQWA